MDPSGASSNTEKSEIQPQQSRMERPSNESEEKKKELEKKELEKKELEEKKKIENAIKNQIFHAAMENKWTKVMNLYINNKFVRESKLTRSEDTALHLAISSYHPDRDDSSQHPHLTCIKKMIDGIPGKDRQRILKQKNEKGNTPLHLAAELGSVPIIACMVSSKDRLLIWETNLKGETPLFITAYRGKLQAFLYLHQCCQNEKEKDPIKLCRRGDGDNILHAAISGEYFELAFQIIHHYEPLVNRYNVEGMSPLHFLSRMPQVFKSGTHFRFIDSIIYYCTNIEDLELRTYKAEDKEKYHKLDWNLPENYQTMVEFLELLWNGILKTCDERKRNGKLFPAIYTIFIKCPKCLIKIVLLVLGIEYLYRTYFGKQENKSKETSGVTDVNQENSSQGHQSHPQNDLENQDTTGASNENQEKKSPGHQNAPKNLPTEDERKRNGKLFAAISTIFIKCPKCLIKIVLLVLGIEYIYRTYFGKQENKSKETSGVTDVNQENSSQGHQSHRQNDLENPPNQDKRERNHKLFPDNYTIFIEFLKCLMKIVLLVLGIGVHRIKKLEERKRQHTQGVQIMKLMIKKEERYKFYENTGEKPEKGLDRQISAPPTTPPIIMEEGPSNIAQNEQSPTSSTDEKKIDDVKSEAICSLNTDKSKTKETPLLMASKMGIVEMVRRILKKFPTAIQDTNSDEKNILLLSVEHRQTDVYNWLIGEKYPECVYYQVDKHGNNAMHLAAMYQKLEVWRIPGSALQLQGERKWYKYVKHTLPPQSYVRYNKKGQTPRQIFGETHKKLLDDGTQWLVTTANSFSVVAALIATVAFATSATFPGGADDEGRPHLEKQPAFDVFSISSLVSLCFSVTALVFFLAILTSRCQHNDFEKDLPRKLLLGLTSLFASITAILISFCAAHFFVLGDKFRTAAFPMYGATCIPVVFFAFNQFPLYVDLIRSYIQNLPLRSYKVFYTDSSEATSSDQMKEGKEKDD